jgi:hypothetical protein
MNDNCISDQELEVWTDDPIHFNTLFARAMWPNVRHVKFPHCFNLDDALSSNFKRDLEERWTKASSLKKYLYWPWLRFISGVDYGHRTVFDRAYTFNVTSPWAKQSIDISHLITTEAFVQTYQSFPQEIKLGILSQLQPIRLAPGPLILLLLFGLTPSIREAYQNAVARIFSERNDELADCNLAVKIHPGAIGLEEEVFFNWLETRMPGRIFPIRSGINLEFFLHELQPDYIWAGPCGAMPVLRRLQGPRLVALPEITELFAHTSSGRPNTYEHILGDIEVW